MIKIGFGGHSTTIIIRTSQNSIGNNLGPYGFGLRQPDSSEGP